MKLYTAGNLLCYWATNHASNNEAADHELQTCIDLLKQFQDKLQDAQACMKNSIDKT